MGLASVKENKTVTAAVISGLAAAIAVYLFIVMFVSPEQSETNIQSYERSKQIPQGESISNLDQKLKSGYVIAALPVADIGLLKQRIRQGTRINILGGKADNPNNAGAAQTILTNVEVIDLQAADGSALREQDSGLLILLSQQESERLFSLLDSGTARIVISGGLAK